MRLIRLREETSRAGDYCRPPSSSSRSTAGHGHAAATTAKLVDVATVAPQLLVTRNVTVTLNPPKVASYILETVRPESDEPSPNDHLNEEMLSVAAPEVDALASNEVANVPGEPIARISPESQTALALKEAVGVAQAGGAGGGGEPLVVTTISSVHVVCAPETDSVRKRVTVNVLSVLVPAESKIWLWLRPSTRPLPSPKSHSYLAMGFPAPPVTCVAVKLRSHRRLRRRCPLARS